ncbi:MAG: Gfo/Idh/MocA family oxidoreductase [Bryobacterales bacterium]|nr:Gfo/Idh/MocA family oxidoreductase [Bryobacterales bacterium]
MSVSRRLMFGGVLAATTSIATRKPSPSSAEAAASGWKSATRKEVRAKARAAGEKRYRVAVIGAGASGQDTIQRLVARERTDRDVEIVGVCDVYEPRLQKAVALAHLDGPQGYKNYEQVLARTDVDVVVIATPPHWHYRMAIDAMNAGKDVWLEPPMALTLEESQQVAQAANSLKRVLQLGCHQMLDPRFRQAQELINEGAIGTVVAVQLATATNALAGEWNEYVEEEASLHTVNWEKWQGPAVKRPFSAERLFRWRKYWDYSGGLATESVLYKLAPALAMLKAPPPVRVSATGGIFVQKDREVPDMFSMMVEYADFQLSVSASTATVGLQQFAGDAIFGNMGTITFTPNSVQVKAEPVWEPKLPESKRGVHVFETWEMDTFNEHFTDFLDAVRARRQPAAGVDFGMQLMTPVLLAVDSYRESRMRLYDWHIHRTTDKPQPRVGYEGNGKNHPDGKKRLA